jgi:hypothetical protein
MKKVIAMLLVAVLALTLVLSVSAESESWVDPDTGISYLQLLNCDQKPGGSNNYEVDKENMQEGEGCLSFVVSKDSVNQMLLAEPVDGEGYDTLEFDLYVSDVVLFDLFAVGGTNSGLEITSSGYCDNQELSWKLGEIRDFNEGGELAVGWNHIILPLDTAIPRTEDGHHPDVAGPFDITNINFMRFFMVGESGEHTITVKIDNICLSDRKAITAEAEKQAALKKSAEKVIEKINDLPEITAENYQDYKLNVASCRSLYDKLSEEGREYVPADLLKKLLKAEAAIAHYEANPPSEEQPDDQQPDGEKPDDETPDDGKGCQGMMSVGAVAMIVMALSLGVTVLNKKKG